MEPRGGDERKGFSGARVLPRQLRLDEPCCGVDSDSNGSDGGGGNSLYGEANRRGGRPASELDVALAAGAALSFANTKGRFCSGVRVSPPGSFQERK